MLAVTAPAAAKARQGTAGRVAAASRPWSCPGLHRRPSRSAAVLVLGLGLGTGLVEAVVVAAAVAAAAVGSTA